MNVQEAAKRLQKSEPTIRRWIRDGKLDATMVDGVYDIPESAVNEQSMSGHMTDEMSEDQVTAMSAHIQSLERQLEEKDKQISELHQLLMASERQSQLLLEHRREPWYRRWFKREKDADSS